VRPKPFSYVISLNTCYQSSSKRKNTWRPVAPSTRLTRAYSSINSWLKLIRIYNRTTRTIRCCILWSAISTVSCANRETRAKTPSNTLSKRLIWCRVCGQRGWNWRRCSNRGRKDQICLIVCRTTGWRTSLWLRITLKCIKSRRRSIWVVLCWQRSQPQSIYKTWLLMASTWLIITISQWPSSKICWKLIPTDMSLLTCTRTFCTFKRNMVNLRI